MVRFSQYWVDPDDELRQINNFEEEKKQTQILKNQINQSQGFSVANLSSQYGGFMPSGGIIAAGLKELSLQAPEIKTVVDSYLEQQGKLGKRIRDAARGFVRTAFVGADSLAEAVIKRPFQAAAETFDECAEARGARRGLPPVRPCDLQFARPARTRDADHGKRARRGAASRVPPEAASNGRPRDATDQAYTPPWTTTPDSPRAARQTGR